MLLLLCPILWPIAGLIVGSSLLLIAVSQCWIGIFPGIPTVAQFIAATFLLLAF